MMPPCGDAAAVVEFDGPAAAGDEQAVIEARLGGIATKRSREPLRGWRRLRRR